ncbi:MAG: hypothetical protein FRX48_06650 [Lasallia pustulata]|uniref:Snf2 family helicase atpase n=1 Tax=Lasallia pustulata TaxID=136370 RepID=A0A5M8PMX6_9LECA|nr:MAG: hypothetical protein FRX48_06650 [Lasallia pustulata]
MSSTPMTPATGDEAHEAISSLPSSPPSSAPSDSPPPQAHNDVSDAMLAEEKRMKQASKVKDRNAREEARKEWHDAPAEDKQFANKQLDYLIHKAQIYADAMTGKFQTKGEAAQASRATKLDQPRAQTPSRGRPQKKKDGGKSSIGEMLKNSAQDVKDEAKPTTLGAQISRSANQPRTVSGGVMRNYQLEGLYWLATLYENGLNGILADEMGLGKTIQTISFLAYLRERGTSGPFLVVAPLSTLSNWIEEFARWTPSIPVVLYHGTPAQRAELRSKTLRDEHSAKFPVVCTSYEICMNDQKFLSRHGWKFIIIDEGHRLKNLNCKLIKELKQYRSANRLLITGTPLQNNLAELWSLLNFLMPEVFDTYENFEINFDFSAVLEKGGHKEVIEQQRTNNLVAALHKVLRPFLLRRVKTDVETSLPKKREYILYTPLTTTQKELYREIIRGNSREYLEGKVIERINHSGGNTPNSTRSQSLKRKAESGTATPKKSAKPSRASTPASSVRSGRNGNGKRQSYKELSDREYFRQMEEESSESEDIDEEEQEEIDRAKTIALAKKEIAQKKLQNPLMQLRLACNSPHNFYWPWEDDAAPDESIVSESGKMRMLDRLVPYLFSKGHKVLIFSQFKSQLDIIQDWAILRQGWKVCRIDGQVKQDDRRQQIKDFNEDPACQMFLLSTRAGGQGINLAAADTVILFDSDWNPQQDLQAQDRAHRIGQTKPVIVYRLATKGTIEQNLLEKADGKKRLANVVIQPGIYRSITTTLKHDLDELARLLEENDFEKFEIGDGMDMLSDDELRILTDRSDAAYVRAAKGLDGGDKFKTVERKRDEGGVLAQLAQ